MICRRCALDRPDSDFRCDANGQGQRYPRSICRPCENVRQREVWEAKTEHECHACRRTLPMSCFASRTYRCQDCHRGQALQRTRPERQAERRRGREKRGRQYTPIEDFRPWWARLARGYAGGINLTRHGWRSRKATTEGAWIARLRVELPHLYDPTLASTALEFRAKYHLDHEFRAREIKRTHKRRSDEEHGLFFDDGSLTGEVVRRLFGEAEDCPYCGRWMASDDKTLDHVWPRSKGGWHSATNAVVCCHSCNSRKHARPPATWLKLVPADRRPAVLKLWRSIGVGVEQPNLVA